MDNIISFINENADAYKDMANQLDIDNDIINIAFNTIREFIISRKLILFGGMAIDYALKLKGSRIYDDNVKPDYDIYSPRSIDDAYDLAEELKSLGLDGVSVFVGIHIQTMKISANNLPLADFGYIPQSVYDIMPYLEYNGIRILHPNFQRMDIHLALSFPFSNPPREDILGRLDKDTVRLDKLNEFYGITSNIKEININSGIFIETKLKTTMDINTNGYVPFAFHGFIAYYILRNALDDIIELFKVKDIKDKPIQINVKVVDEFTIKLELPTLKKSDKQYLFHNIIAAPYPNRIVNKQNSYKFISPKSTNNISGGDNNDNIGLFGEVSDDIKIINQYLDLKPVSFFDNKTIENLEIYILNNKLLSVSHNKLDNYIVNTVSPHYLLLYFLMMSYIDLENSEIYILFYTYIMNILNIAKQIYFNAMNENPKNKDRLMENYINSPFSINISTIGTINNNLSYILRTAKNATSLNDTPPRILELSSNIKDLIIDLPKNYFLKSNSEKKRPIFDYKKNILFQRDGKLRI